MNRINQPVILVSIFFTVFAGHFGIGFFTSGDSKWSIHTAMSIAREGDVNLDEYREIINPAEDYRIEIVDGHIYTIFPIGTHILAAPFVFIIDKVLYRMLSYDLNETVKTKVPVDGIEAFVASFIVALTAGFIYCIARLFLDKKYAVLLAYIFSFCTSTWSTASRALWQHGPSMLMLTMALYLTLLARDKPRLIQFVSLPLAFSYVIRPTNTISIFLSTIFVFVEYRQYFLRYLLWATTIAVPFLIFNFTIYDSLLSPYYLRRLGLSPYFFALVFANLRS
jgi:hypothetical protein